METQDNPKVDDKIVFMSVDEEHTISIDYHCASCLNVMNGMGANRQLCYVTSPQVWMHRMRMLDDDT
jgi:hypothetical protein